MNRRDFLSACLGAAAPRSAARLPSIVFIYADDLGYGDLACYGATRVRTPNIDRLAAGGIRFTDAHSSAATCTPSRYSLLTGEYAFRMEEARILPGDAPLLIRPGRVTLPSILKARGYRTGAVGKWHLMTIVNGISRIGYMSGGKSALWKDELMANVLAGRAVGFIESHNAWTTATVTRPSRNSVGTGPTARCEAASTAVSKAGRAYLSWSTGPAA